MADLLNEKDQLRALENLLKEGKVADSLELAKRVLKEFPESFQVQFVYARILRATGQMPQAQEMLEKLLAKHRGHLNLLLELGSLMADQGKNRQALEYYNQALFIDPFNKKAKETLLKLKNAEDKLRWKADTLPEEDVVRIRDRETLPDDQTGEMPITPDSIRVEEEPVHEAKPSIPGVDEAYMEPEAVKVRPRKKGTDPTLEESLMADPEFVRIEENGEEDRVSTEDVADLFAESLEKPEPDMDSTRKPPQPREPRKGGFAGSEEFVTESAGRLYLSQGLYEEALYIYEKLYQQKKEARFAEKIEELKSKCQCQKKIQALSAFLKLISERGG